MLFKLNPRTDYLSFIILQRFEVRFSWSKTGLNANIEQGLGIFAPTALERPGRSQLAGGDCTKTVFSVWSFIKDLGKPSKGKDCH